MRLLVVFMSARITTSLSGGSQCEPEVHRGRPNGKQPFKFYNLKCSMAGKKFTKSTHKVNRESVCSARGFTQSGHGSQDSAKHRPTVRQDLVG